ncbi:FAR1-related protein [Striga asiatica]|uniref:FAR1-related protein n=1 Tax=Striga asiatica TaxID=4170 RepID=A0A5A7R4S2_STRAF|nr:FAR1-related protein [Striga asiatica]
MEQPSATLQQIHTHDTGSSAMVMKDGENGPLLEYEIVNTDCSTNTGAPEAGIEFKDIDNVFDFYKQYAYSVGFPAKKRNSRKDDDGVLHYVTFTCSREGQRMSGTRGTLRSQPTTQTDCKAQILASLDDHGYWRINTVYLDHNHKCSPTKSRLYRCHRELSATVKRRLEVNDVAGIPLHKSFNSVVVQAGGYENMTFVEKDCRNYIEKFRRLSLGEGDAAAIQSYFIDMQARDKYEVNKISLGLLRLGRPPYLQEPNAGRGPGVGPPTLKSESLQI